MIKEIVSKRLKEQMVEAKTSIDELARKSGVSTRRINQFLKGEFDEKIIVELFNISGTLDTNVSHLIGEEEGTTWKNKYNGLIRKILFVIGDENNG